MRALRGVLLLCAVAACRKPESAGEDEERAAPIQVTCAAPAARAATDRIVVRGVVAAPPDRQAVVAPAVAGRIAEVAIVEGQRVARGDVLAVIDEPTLAAAEGEAAAQLASARAAAVAAGAAAARAHRLLDEGIAARKDVEDADARAAASAGELRAAGARRTLAGAQRARSRVTTPIAGTVVRILRRRGELVDGTAATPVAEVADPTQLELRADVAAADAVRLVEGLEARVILDALPDRPLGGKIVVVAPAVDPATALGWVRVAIAVPVDAGVHPRLGLAGRAEIAVGARPGLSVPAAAVRRGAAGHPEVVVCAGDTARVKEVELGGRAGDAVVIASGLAPGDRVVVDHVLNLADGATIAETR